MSNNPSSRKLAFCCKVAYNTTVNQFVIFFGYAGLVVAILYLMFQICLSLVKRRQAVDREGKVNADIENVKRRNSDSRTEALRDICNLLHSSLPVAPSKAAMDSADNLAEIVQILKSVSKIPELITAIEKLATIMEKAAPPLEKIGDDAFLIARGARDLADQVAAFRAVVYGGRRSDEFPVTTNDSEGIRRADMEADIANLMQDHGMSRRDAEVRVKDMYSRIPR